MIPSIRPADLTLAHALARIGLGVNLALHGLTRIPALDAFSKRLDEQFANTFLPAVLLHIAAYGILYSEAIIGPFLVLGLFVRQALAGAAMLMIVLLFGTCLSQQFSVATTQMIYLGFMIPLLATVGYDGFSLDSWRRRRRTA